MQVGENNVHSICDRRAGARSSSALLENADDLIIKIEEELHNLSAGSLILLYEIAKSLAN